MNSKKEFREYIFPEIKAFLKSKDDTERKKIACQMYRYCIDIAKQEKELGEFKDLYEFILQEFSEYDLYYGNLLIDGKSHKKDIKKLEAKLKRFLANLS